MKFYAQVTRRTHSGELREALGSFAVLILDGRRTLPSMIEDAQALAHREKGSGWRVIRSTRIIDSDVHPETIAAEGEI